jgi:hypothetical protein
MPVGLDTWANLGSLVAVVTGVAFGMQQWLQEKRARRDDRDERAQKAAVMAVQSLQTVEVYEAARRVLQTPGELTHAHLEKDADLAKAVSTVYMAMEPLGYLVYVRAVPLRVATEFVGGSVKMLWEKIRPMVLESRRRNGTVNSYEWFQWLAEQMAAHRLAWKEKGAYAAFRQWDPEPGGRPRARRSGRRRRVLRAPPAPT